MQALGVWADTLATIGHQRADVPANRPCGFDVAPNSSNAYRVVSNSNRLNSLQTMSAPGRSARSPNGKPSGLLVQPGFSDSWELPMRRLPREW